MITEIDIHLPLRKAMKEQARRKAVAQQLEISPHRVLGMRLLKDSIDKQHHAGTPRKPGQSNAGNGQ